MTMHLDRFPVGTFETLDPTYVQSDDHESPQFWALHLRAGETVETVEALATTLKEALPDVVLDYTGGDSWNEWAEPYTLGDRALHVYLRAGSDREALKIGRQVRRVSLNPLHQQSWTWAVSTAHDWAEQITVPSKPVGADDLAALFDMLDDDDLTPDEFISAVRMIHEGRDPDPRVRNLISLASAGVIDSDGLMAALDRLDRGQ